MTKTFQLHRDTDVSGVSAAGVVADGAQFPDGTVVVRWRGEHASTVVWNDLASALAVHGHDGATRVVWGHELPRELRRLSRHFRDALAASTPGKWVTNGGAVCVHHGRCTCGSRRFHLAECGLTVIRRQEDSEPTIHECADAHLIALAHNHLADLLDAADAALELLDGDLEPIDLDHQDAA